MQASTVSRASARFLIPRAFGLLTAASACMGLSAQAQASSLSIGGTPASSVVLASTYSFKPTASSSNGYTLYFTVKNLPGWASFNATTGTVSGTPTGATGTYSGVTVSVSDGHGNNASLPAFSVKVTDAAPTISGTPAATAEAGQFYVFMPSAVESTKYVTMSFSVTNLPSWASFNTSTGTLSGVIPAGTTGSFSNIGITVTNSAGQSASLPAFSIKAVSSSSTQKAALAYVLTSTYDSSSNFATYFADANLDGVALQEGWNTYEATQGTYNFSHLDTVLAQAQAAGKHVTIHMTSGPGGLPNWLAGAGAQSFTSGGVSYILPWDPVFLSNYSSFIAALGAHIAGEGYASTVFDVSLVVPELEMNIQGCSNNLMGSVAYSRSNYLAAWQQIGASLQAAFPSQHKFVSPPGGESICAGSIDASFYSDLLSDLLGSSDSFWMFAADLNGQTSTAAAGSGRTSPYLSTFLGVTGVAYQMLGAATAGGTATLGGTYPANLQQAVCAGLQSGGQYFEIYSLDVLNSNTSIQAGIQAVHQPSLCH